MRNSKWLTVLGDCGRNREFLEGESPMWRDRYAPMALLALVPALRMAMEAGLAELDRLLCNAPRKSSGEEWRPVAVVVIPFELCGCFIGQG